MSLQTPLARARGLGSAKEGLHHWWMQRVTAVALLPLTLWLVPLNSSLIISLIIAAFYHAALGMQIVFEDYISSKPKRIVCIVTTNLLLFFLAVTGIFSIVRIVLGGH